MSNLKYFSFKALFQDESWISPAYVGIDEKGVVQYLSKEAPAQSVAVEAFQGFALPGFQNAHSHAFQFAMAGHAEKHGPGTADDFWSWREAMYNCALSMDPDQMEAVATMLYAEMLRKGYTHVAEFHYLHHDKHGNHYSNLAEMGERLVSAAKTAGIKITLVPIFYQKGNFGVDAYPKQRRFISKTVDEYLQLLDDSANVVLNQDHARLGFGVHSLRAVNANDIVKTFEAGPKNIPFHLHAAEQLKEIKDCFDFLKQRPVEWLLDHLPLDNSFHLVHCTHMESDEVKRLAKSGANVVLCPGTEGNLGDGIFKLSEFAKEGGHWSIGTDSHISLNPLEDLRWLDYAQRFTTHKRNTFDDGAQVLINKTIHAGRKAMGLEQKTFFEIDKPFDAVVYNAKSPLLMQSDLKNILPAILYTADTSDILGTLVNGKWIVKDQRHLRAEEIENIFRKGLF